MAYRMNIGNELAQVKYCEDIDEVRQFCEDHGLDCMDAGVFPNDFPIMKGYWRDNDIEVQITVQSVG